MRGSTSIYGLTPTAVTFDGGFQLDQWRSDESPICDPPPTGAAAAACYVAPMYHPVASVVGFPGDSDVKALVHNDVVAFCTPLGLATWEDTFAYPSSLASYLGGFCVNPSVDGLCQDYCADADNDGWCDNSIGRPRFLPNLVQLEGRVSGALATLTPGAATDAAALTLNDFLRGQVVLCSDSPNNNASCVDERQALCGMALYRTAMLAGGLTFGLAPRPPPGGVVGPPEMETLFCGDGDAATVGASCRLSGATYPTTVALQEHNRFYKELTQATRYAAANDLSDAFFAMYRAANSQLERSQVLSYKKGKLQSAFARHTTMAREMFSPVSTTVLFAWPMERFETHGSLWLKQLHSVLKDRLASVSELIDLKRRVLASSGEADFAFAQHLVHFEYLGQAYLMALQQKWERDEFAYEGQGPAALEQGQAIVSRVASGRNPLGLHPSQIYFENANLTTSNWKNYRSQILSGPPGSGLLPEVRAAVDGAVTNLKASLRDHAAFVTQIQEAKQRLDQELDALCGPDLGTASASSDCQLDDPALRQFEKSCQGPTCLTQYSCNDPKCDAVVKAFNTATGENLRGTACDVDTPVISVTVGSTQRHCNRGQMGVLQQERAQLLLKRAQTYRNIESLLRSIATQTQYISQTESDDTALVNYLKDANDELSLWQEGIMAAHGTAEAIAIGAAALNCSIGFSTNCVGAALEATALLTAQNVEQAVVGNLEILKARKERFMQITMTESSQTAELRRERMALDNAVTSVDNYIAEYETTSSMLASVSARIADTRFLAERAAQRSQETISNVIDNLIGNQSGDVLLRNKYVQDANAKFDDLLLATYKLAMAFIHSYNLKAQSEQITNRVFQLMTPDDVADFLRDLDTYEANYCGGAGIDCDSINNIEHFRYSLREELFPNLRDVVDARTGAVLTKGEQFHNIITSDAFVKTRQRAGRLVKQIEIPFAIWLNDRGTNGGYVEPWMVSPLECNHIIAPGAGGTLAVNAIGTRLRNLTYEMWRGNTDYIRSCDPVETVSRDGVVTSEYPINTFSVGYAPQNTLAQKDQPLSYLTHSNGLLACKNVPETGGNFITSETCFKYFARERSLAAPDWNIVIPFDVGYGNEWIYGADQPIIEDIVLYFRYRTRPI